MTQHSSMISMNINDPLGTAAKSVCLAGLLQAFFLPDLTCSSESDPTLPCPFSFADHPMGFLGLPTKTDPIAARLWCVRHWWASYAFVVFYLWSLQEGQNLMRSCDPVKVPKAAFLGWNVFLASCSAMAAVRTLPPVLSHLRSHGLVEFICTDGDYMQRTYPALTTASYWAFLFVCSKYFELIDTALLVVKKRNVTFLHWYHHSTVLLYCWHAYMWAVPTGLLFACMNLSVHAVMYVYYAQASWTQAKPNWSVAVTTLQVLQMVVGTCITGLHLYKRLREPESCVGNVPNLSGALAMYFSYFGLFAALFYRRYGGGRKSSGHPTQETAQTTDDAEERLKIA